MKKTEKKQLKQKLVSKHINISKHLFMDVGRVLDKGLEMSRREKSGEGKAGGALEGGNVLEEWEPEIAMSSMKASSQWDYFSF